jgi:outer membrane protein
VSVEARRGLRVAMCVLAWMLSATLTAAASAFDVLHTDDDLARTALEGRLASGLASQLPEPSSCQPVAMSSPVQLAEVIERALCNNPKTRQAWVNVKAKAAGVGIARSAFLPTITGNWQGIRDDTLTHIGDEPAFDSVSRANVQTASVSLNWTLFDFGTRSASLANASALLAAARATQDATLQTTFIDVARDFYAAQAAAGALASSIDIERMTFDSLRAAQMRVDKGIAPVSDALQAQTAHAQSAINTIKARGKLQTTLGTLAADMALPPQSPLTMPDVDSGAQADAQFSESIDTLIDAVTHAHPSVLAANAQLDAAIEKAKQTRAEGLPTFGLVSKYSRNNQPANPGLGLAPIPSNAREWYLGFQLTIPLFEGFGRTYQVRQADAQVELQREVLKGAQQQVSLDVWTAFQELSTSTESLKRYLSLVDIANRSFVAAQFRYREGVGNILELLNAQTGVANATQQRVQAITDWRSARLRLAGSLGRLDAEAMHDASRASGSVK